MKIKILLYLFFSITFSMNAQNFWEKIDSPTSKKLTSVIFIDSSNGWAAGDSGLIIHTTDAGESWTTQNYNDSIAIVNLCFLSDQLGFASATSTNYEPFGSYLLKTTDGGMNWSSDFLRIGEAFVHSITFIDSLNGFAVGYPSFFLRTSDGGESWRSVTRDSSIYAQWPPETVKFYDSSYGFACGGTRDVVGVIWKTTDSGYSWTTVVDSTSAPPEPLYAIQIFDSLNVLVLGGDPEFGASVLRSYDGGSSWRYYNVGILWFPVEMGFRTAAEGWAPMGPKRGFLFTDDSGENWSFINTPDSAYVTNISFPDSIHGYAVGINGTMLKYTYPKPNNIETETGMAGSFYLAQNYPNPFNPVTSISYRIKSAGMVSIKVYNVLGKQIASLVNEYKPEGSYTVEFNGSDLPSGVYLYRLRSGEYSAVKKMLLVK